MKEFFPELYRQTSTTSPLSSPEQPNAAALSSKINYNNSSPLSIAVTGFDDAPMTSSPLRRNWPVKAAAMMG